MSTPYTLLGIAIDSRSRRRFLVLTHYSTFALILAPFWLAEFVDKTWLVLAIPGAIVFAASFWTLSQLVRDYAESASRHDPSVADERQVQVRGKAFAIAYRLFAAGVTLGIVYTMIGGDFGWWLPGAADVPAIAFGLIVLSATLPSAVIAWIEPDEPRELAEDRPATLRASAAHR